MMKLQMDEPVPSFCGLVGKSKGMKKLFHQISIIARKEVKVLIQGERGTGKELVARAVRALSPRKDKPYKVINCAGLTRDLLATELWGHEKGAFTGALTKKPGLVTACHNGILFLDEIGDLGLEAQAMLLRFFQEGQVRPIGALDDIHVDVRIIAATNKDLQQEMALGRFRADLFDRLNEITLHVPPLKERDDDIELLTGFFLQKYNNLYKEKVMGGTTEAMNLIRQYSWPGNVRELEKAISRAIVFSSGHSLFHKEDLSLDQCMENHPSESEEKDNDLNSKFDETHGDKITPRQREIIRMAMSNSGIITNKELIQALKISREIIRRDLNGLCSLGLLEQRRKRRGCFFTLKSFPDFIYPQ